MRAPALPATPARATCSPDSDYAQTGVSTASYKTGTLEGGTDCHVKQPAMCSSASSAGDSSECTNQVQVFEVSSPDQPEATASEHSSDAAVPCSLVLTAQPPELLAVVPTSMDLTWPPCQVQNQHSLPAELAPACSVQYQLEVQQVCTNAASLACCDGSLVWWLVLCK